MPLAVEIMTPNRLLLRDEQVDELNVPGEKGYLGILPGHIALLTTLGHGELMYRKGEQRRYLAVFGGYMEVNDNKVTILADVAENIAEIDRVRAEADLQQALEKMRNPGGDVLDFERASAEMSQAQVRLQVSRRAS